MNWLKLSTILIFLSLNAKAQVNKAYSLDIEGTVTAERVSLKGAVVNVLRDGKYFTSFVTDQDGEYNLYLPLGSEYVITVTKENFVKKIYTVNTKGVPAENATKPFPVIEAGVDLFKSYEGLDYSLFEQPMNKFYYNAKKDNFEYDREYFKMMQALVAEFRRNEQKNLAEISQQKEARKQAELTAQRAREREEYEAKAMKAMEEEQKAMAVQKTAPAASESQAAVKSPGASGATVTAVQGSRLPKDARVAALLLQYKPGVTEETIEAKGVLVIKRVVVRDEMAWVYLKKIFSWGGVAFFRDGIPITENVFEQETKKGS